MSELNELAILLGKEDTKIEINGKILNNCELQFHNEPARHKILDIIGDVSLLGKPIKRETYLQKNQDIN